MKVFFVVLVFLGILSGIVIAIPQLGVFFAHTIILFPLALLYWEIARLFLILLTICLAILIFQRFKKSTVTATLLLCGFFGLIFGPSIWINSSIEQNANDFIAGDHDSINLPLETKTLGIVSELNSDSREIYCDAFCLHALLSGAIETVLVYRTKDPHLVIDYNEIAREFTLEQLGVCPEFKFEGSERYLPLPSSSGNYVTNSNAVNAMELSSSLGNCLLEKEVQLTEADAIITLGSLRIPESDLSALGFKTNVSGFRITLHTKGPTENQFIEKFRRTFGSYRLVRTPLFPSYEMSGIRSVKKVWRKQATPYNSEGTDNSRGSLVKFVTNNLGLSLNINEQTLRSKILGNAGD